MSDVINAQMLYFAAAFAEGSMFLFGYDILRAFRREFQHPAFLISAEDFLYWTAAGIRLFFLAYEKNNGVIRGYALASMLCGMLFYFYIFSKSVIKLFSILFRAVYHGITVIFRLILIPAGESSKKMRKNVGKTLKNTIKQVRMILSKK